MSSCSGHFARAAQLTPAKEKAIRGTPKPLRMKSLYPLCKKSETLRRLVPRGRRCLRALGGFIVVALGAASRSGNASKLIDAEILRMPFWMVREMRRRLLWGRSAADLRGFGLGPGSALMTAVDPLLRRDSSSRPSSLESEYGRGRRRISMLNSSVRDRWRTCFVSDISMMMMMMMMAAGCGDGGRLACGCGENGVG
ncbi:hypothetical protein F5Y15DRAFT_286996 [Xylariaceae sp. FL0016]|nr:hypothetical protein F5Y15DRAFT_286996 [Xylariaceae sp. FL0016]